MINYLLIAVNALIFFMEVSLSDIELNAFLINFALVPARYTDPAFARETGLASTDYLPFVSNMFLHGGWMHFIGNMWTLWIFGDNVEDRMGHFSYLVFYLITGIAASYTHFYLHPSSIMPALGASGAISGVMAAYMFLFPGSKILFFFPLFIIPYFINIPAFVYIGFWFLSQLFSGTASLASISEASGIAFWAHIGGFVAGAILYRFFLDKNAGTGNSERRRQPAGWF